MPEKEQYLLAYARREDGQDLLMLFNYRNIKAILLKEIPEGFGIDDLLLQTKKDSQFSFEYKFASGGMPQGHGLAVKDDEDYIAVVGSLAEPKEGTMLVKTVYDVSNKRSVNEKYRESHFKNMETIVPLAVGGNEILEAYKEV